MVRKLAVLFVFNLFVQFCFAQSNIVIDPQEIYTNQNISGIIDQICKQKNITITYSSSQFENRVVRNLPKQSLGLKEYLQYIFDDHSISLTKVSTSNYILTLKPLKISISGYIQSNTGEVLPGATIINRLENDAVFSDEKGFYFLECVPGKIHLEVRYVGHEALEFIEVQKKSFIKNHNLNNISVLPVFVKQERQLTDPLTEVLPISVGINNTIFGDKDPLNTLKSLPGVLPGGEGISGLHIRGGGPEQNLILWEGMPLYESYHTGNLSSIFIEESIRSIDFMKSGLPARYSGRLNSVINIQLKDGNNTERKTSLNTGLQGITFFTQGPISTEKLTYAVSFRNSWINTLIGPISKKFSIYDQLDVSYNDIQAKVSYRLKNTQKLSLSYYKGRDRLALSKDLELNQNLSIGENNTFKSTNSMASLNYDHLLTNKLKMNVQAGLLSYNVFSRGLYSYQINQVDTFTNYLDVINNSKINDKQINANLDYYFRENIKFKFGVGFVNHSFNPAVKQSISKVNNIVESIIDPDSAIIANEIYSYLEGNLKIGKFIFVPGIHFVNYREDKNILPSFQPRFQLHYKPSEALQFNSSYTYAVQYIHLLASSGLGLPSELWIPTTEKIPAENINHLSIGMKYSINKNWNLSLGAYNKTQNNSIEYTEPVDKFLNVVNPVNIVPVLNSQRDWERKIEIGEGRAFGYEFMLRFLGEHFQAFTSYHYGRAYKTFANINDGDEYVSRYDKPHNIAIGSNYNIGKWQLSSNWVYSSGQPFTLADVVIIAPLDPKLSGIKFLQASSRHNYRMPSFHQLSVNASYDFLVNGINSKLTFGVYNLYNRLNAYYIYAADDKDTRKYIKVSIFPILPQMSLVMNW